MSQLTELSQRRGSKDDAVTTTDAARRPGAHGTMVLQPAVEIVEDDAGITLLADMPGVPRDKLDVQLDGETLVIDGEMVVPGPQDLRGLWAEVSAPRYRRAFTLSRELDTARIEAGMKDGVLTLKIPKQAHAQPRRIAVSTQ